MSSQTLFNKKFSNSSKNTVFGHFWLPRSTFKVNFLNSQVKFRKIPGIFTGDVLRIIVITNEFSVFKKVRGASRFASRHIPKSITSASCNIVGRPFVACFTCSFVFSHFCFGQVSDC